MDEKYIEMAEGQTLAEVDKGLARIREQLPTGYGPEFCETCEEPVPEVRRQHGFRHCKDCAEHAEKQARFSRRR